MLPFLSEWLLSALVAVMVLGAAVGILLLRVRANLHRTAKPGAKEAGLRLCGCHTACQEHLYQIAEPGQPGSEDSQKVDA